VRVELPAESGVIALPQTAVVTSLYGDYVYVVAPADSPAQPKPAEGDAALPQSAPEKSPETPAPAPGSAASPAPAPAAGQPVAADGEKLVARQVFVTVGRRQGNLIEIAKGVDPGQTVITSGQNKLSNNAPVTINNDVDPAKLAQDGGDGAS
jgi:membrane fusion protein (multidrug efflux system)